MELRKEDQYFDFGVGTARTSFYLALNNGKPVIYDQYGNKDADTDGTLVKGATAHQIVLNSPFQPNSIVVEYPLTICKDEEEVKSHFSTSHTS